MERAPELAAEEVAQAARTWMTAVSRNDRVACAEILADEFTMVTDRGSEIDKDQWLDNMERRMRWQEPPAFLDARVLDLGDAAVMTSRNRIRATLDGKEWSAELYLTDVWVRRDRQWQIVRRHASRMVASAD
jgi:ketosteroid isomerase-like protein